MRGGQRLDADALLARAVAGDRGAVGLLLRSLQPDVWRYATHLVGRNDADDVAQDALLRVMRALPRYRGDASTRTWALAITRRAAADWVRGQRRRRRIDDAVRAEPYDGVHHDGPVHDLAEAVRALDPDRREAFVLTQVLGLAYHDAAAVCECPVGTIRSRVARARFDLATSLRDEDHPAGNLRRAGDD